MHAVRDALNKAQKKDRAALVEDLKKIHRAEREQDAKGALAKLQERWGGIYSKIMER